MINIEYVKIGKFEYPVCFSFAASKALIQKYGSAEALSKKLSTLKDNQIEGMDLMIDMLELLIAQGCRYKNIIDEGMPLNEKAHIKDGKYIPIDKEKIELSLDINEIAKISDIVLSLITTEEGTEAEKN